MEIVRQVGNWSLLKKVTATKNTLYWVDNGSDDVSEYMDEFDCYDLIHCENHEFANKCAQLF